MAHDNPILNYDESILIFNNISNAIRFIESLERKISEKQKMKPEQEVVEAIDWKDLPFQKRASGNRLENCCGL